MTASQELNITADILKLEEERLSQISEADCEPEMVG